MTSVVWSLLSEINGYPKTMFLDETNRNTIYGNHTVDHRWMTQNWSLYSRESGTWTLGVVDPQVIRTQDLNRWSIE